MSSKRTRFVGTNLFTIHNEPTQLSLLSQINLTPLEVAIIGMQDKIQSLRRTLEQDPPDGKLLQMQLQGGIATAVNQVCLHNTTYTHWTTFLQRTKWLVPNCPLFRDFTIKICAYHLQGPFHIAQLFLNIPKSEHTHLHRRLKVCFKEFTRRLVMLLTFLQLRLSL